MFNDFKNCKVWNWLYYYQENQIISLFFLFQLMFIKIERYEQSDEYYKWFHNIIHIIFKHILTSLQSIMNDDIYLKYMNDKIWFYFFILY